MVKRITMEFSHCTFILDELPSSLIKEIKQIGEFAWITQLTNKPVFKVVYFSDEHESILKITSESTLELIVSLNEMGEDSIAKQIFRCLRYINETEMRKAGMCFFHAASIEIAGKGIIITADKFSGKTTLLLKLLERYSAKLNNCYFISNDKVAIGKNNFGEISIFSSPISMGVRYDIYNQIISKFPSMQRDLVIDRVDDPKIFISVKEIEELFNVKYKNYTKLDYILKPRFKKESLFKIELLNRCKKEKFFKSQLLDFMTDYPFRNEDKSFFDFNDGNLSDVYDYDVIELTYGESNEAQDGLFDFIESLLK